MASQRSLSRKLKKSTQKLAKAREELEVSLLQLNELAFEADDAEIRGVVSDDGNNRRAATDAVRHRDRLVGHCDRLRAEIAELEITQDRLLDELGGLS